jgi:hypothetical protein
VKITLPVALPRDVRTIRFSYGWFRDQDAVGVDVSGAAWPARFEIRLDRVLEPRWSEWFGGLEVESDADETILRGTVRDRSALQGLLDKAADLRALGAIGASSTTGRAGARPTVRCTGG